MLIPVRARNTAVKFLDSVFHRWPLLAIKARAARLTATASAALGQQKGQSVVLTVMTVETPRMMKVMTVALFPRPFSRRGRRAVRESLARLSVKMLPSPNSKKPTQRGNA
ncbi:MAG: hypothetical protein DVS81_00990 [Candidatus Accumulibacter meliphilus]|uniref:Uncharacterized protein n=1 Tax=Candidatus Accumulibacter meliphilus TaxID=2211374 RepID=A0A369XQE9_9PROT|nr:MAG: hypothetical protein DVS81_00990 [Candidatus Accumulibacter meliphilus]